MRKRTTEKFTGLNKVLLVLVGTKFYWSWSGGPVIIVRTDWCLYIFVVSVGVNVLLQSDLPWQPVCLPSIINISTSSM